jgi:Bacterial regulatory proteins, lacI family
MEITPARRADKQRRRPTIKDVAAAAGVSTTTVSHAVNDKGAYRFRRARAGSRGGRESWNIDRTAQRGSCARSGAGRWRFW